MISTHPALVRTVGFTRHLLGSLPLYLYLLSTLFALQAFAQSASNVAIVVSSQAAWTIEAPEGWVLDGVAARSNGLGAAFTPEDGSWASSEAIMYGITLPKQNDSMSIADVIRQDSIRTTLRHPGTVVEIADPIETIEGIDAIVLHCYPPAKATNGTIEGVAYIDTPTAVACIVLTARTPKAFNNALDAFARLVDSYEWITGNVEQIKKIKVGLQG